METYRVLGQRFEERIVTRWFDRCRAINFFARTRVSSYKLLGISNADVVSVSFPSNNEQRGSVIATKRRHGWLTAP